MYMKKRDIKKIENKLFYIVIFLVLSLYIFSLNSSKKNVKEYEKMYNAAQRMVGISREIYREKLRRGIEIDHGLDINKTGFIGEEFTGITTTLGNLESKRTSANPDFSALLVKIILEQGIKTGDSVAVNFSGSFPALNLSLIVALEELEVFPVILSSMGASTYGANNENFHYLNMENFLLEKGLIRFRSETFSLGGDGDRGINFDEDLREKILEEIEYSKKNQENSFVKNRNFIYESDLEIALRKKIEIFENTENLKMFINVGGNQHSEELLKYFKGEEIPVLSLLNIKEIATKHELPIDPFPMGKIGTSSIYYLKNTTIYEILILATILVYMVIKILRKKQKKKNK